MTASANRQFGRYLIRDRIGRGGMGVVYRAWDPAMGREIAIKVLRARAGIGPEEIERFHREARAAGRVRHPGIIAIHDVGHHDEEPFIVMDLVEGETLKERLERGLERDEALALVIALSDALEHAHQAGVTHRDVKPANVLLEGDRPILTDFGLAADAVDSGQLTATGTLMGTPHYMPPEQVEGRKGGVGPPADVYALAAVLYEALCGRRPFEADGVVGVYKRILTEDPPAPRQFAPDISPALESVILRALSKDPDARYPTAGPFGAALRKLAADVAPALDPPLSRSETPRRRLGAAALAGVLVVGAIAGVLLASGSGDPPPPPTARLIAPTDGAVLPDAIVSIRGEAERVEAVWIDGRLRIAVDADGRFTDELRLGAGTHDLRLSAATDGPSLATVTIHIDPEPPRLQLRAPADGDVLTGPVTVRGSVADPWLEEVRVAGEPVAVGSDGSFSVTIDPGRLAGAGEDVLIEVVALDRAGHRATESVTLRREAAEAPIDRGQLWWRPTPEQIAYARQADRPLAWTGPLGQRFVLVPPGTFQMGSPTGDPKRELDEPLHEVTITRGFYLAATEVTNARFRRFRPGHRTVPPHFPAGFRTELDGDDQPAARVSFDAARAFCRWLGGLAGDETRFRLPSEAEFEYANRAGEAARFFWGRQHRRGAQLANLYDEPTAAMTGLPWPAFPGDDGHRGSSPVGSFAPNALGLHDTTGNAWEWVDDGYAPYPPGPVRDPRGPDRAPRTVRGGSWMTPPFMARSARRFTPDLIKHDLANRVGLRVAADLDAAPR